MRKALFLLLFVAAGVAFALAVGNRAASASTLPVPLLGQDQSATNHNQTTQDAAADATTRQANVNLPISVLSFGSNNGDVSQHNQANTDATAKNDNDTRQGIDQSQNAKADGGRGTSHGSRDGAISQDQSAANDNRTDQRSDASATTRQLNVNAPISVLSFDSNNGDVRQGNDGTTSATAKNDNGTAQKVDQDQRAASKSGRDGQVSQSQDAKNGNETDQSSDATATTKQVNVNAPISVLGFGVNNGNVDQHNSADTSATAKNSNGTDQTVDQNQSALVEGSRSNSWDNWDSWSKGDRGNAGSIDQQQSGTNDNSTDQSAGASALTKQKNFNAPISVLSFGFDGYGLDGCGCSKAGYGGNGVVQHNDAVTTARAANDNWTGQKIDQDQNATVLPSKAEHRDGEYPHRPRHHKPEPCECEHHPKPVPDPCGCEHHPKPVPDPCGCEHHPKPVPEPCGCQHQPVLHPSTPSIVQRQNGANDSSTTQSANADATTRQKNVNVPFSFLTFSGPVHEPTPCGCPSTSDGPWSTGHAGAVQQHNNGTTNARATNGNSTLQQLGQREEALIGRR